MAEQVPNSVPDIWTAFADVQQARTYDAGAVLFEEQAPVAGIYLVQKGQVRLGMSTDSGAYRVLATAGPGTLLGLSEAILGGPHKLSARALGRTELLFVERADLMSYLAEHQGLCMDIVRMLSEDLHGLYHKFRTLSVDPTRVRRRGTDGRFN